MERAGRVSDLVPVLLLGLVLAIVLTNQVEGSQGIGKRAKLELFLTQLKNGAGLPVQKVRCSSYSDENRPQLKWQCRITFKYGPHTQVRTSQMEKGGPVEMWYDAPPPPAGAWYRDCQRTETKRYCRRIGRKQIRACMDRPSDYHQCRNMVYGHLPKSRSRVAVSRTGSRLR